ncbi:MAG: DEAD/DEAH box helicase [Treponema sp.]|nr:DEAD/DEAH box helicase [Treponema sp.]
MNFSEFNLNDQLLKGLEAAGYVTCTPVQEQVLKMSQDGSDLYVQSQTGTGKTAAYLVAIIQEMLSKEENKGKKALIMVPTRELAVQVEEEAKTLAGPAGLKAFSVYGGVGYEKQIANIKKGVDIIVGTPGRLIDLQEGGNLNLSEVAFVVVDEADRMFDMGFYPDLRTIMKHIPANSDRQTMLFSATLNTYVKNLAWEYTRDPKEIECECENITVSEIQQELLHVSSDEKMKLLIGILKNENPESVIIFCNTKRSCEVTAKRLAMNDIKAEFIIGDLPQSKRLAILKSFKAGEVKVLVATDVAARGIDVDDLSMVINFDLPNEAENYVHRIGRTARAGKSGKAYTFCSEQDVYSLPAIERYIEMSIPAKVAYPEQMLEDKSAGIYIKTENWRDDDDFEGRGGNRRGGRGDKWGNGGHKDSHGHGKGGGKRHEKRDFDGKGKKDYKKDGYKKDFNKVKKFDDKEIAGMENMSFEDRMKLYKEKYGNSKSSGYRNNRDGKKNYNKGGYTNAGGKGKKSYAGKNSRQNAQKQPEKKMGLIAKIKAFFGRK